MTSNVPRSPATLVALLAAVLIGGCGGAAVPSATSSPSTAAPTATGASLPPSASPGLSLTPVPVPSDPTALPSLPPIEGHLNALIVQDDAIVVAGAAEPFVPSIRVLRGGSWTGASVPESVGQVMAMTRIGDRLVAVGNTLPDVRSGFIWTSDDGSTWTEVLTIPDAALYDVAAGDGALVAAGAYLTDEMAATAAAWVSRDGTAWDEAAVDGAERTPISNVTATATGFVAIGDRPLGDPRPVWTATDPAAWSPLENDLGDTYLPTDLAATASELVLVGASGRSGDQHPFLARSPDGAAWDSRLLSEAEGYASAVTTVGDRIVVAGVDDDVLTLYFPTGADVVGVAIEPMGASIGALAWHEEWGLIGAGAYELDQMVWLLPTR